MERLSNESNIFLGRSGLDLILRSLSTPRDANSYLGGDGTQGQRCNCSR